MRVASLGALPEGLTAAEAQRICLERGVMVSGAAGFTAPGVEVPRALRIGMGGEVERARVEEGLGIVAGVMCAADEAVEASLCFG